MTGYPAVVYDLGELRAKLPSLHRPIIDTAIAELLRLSRELAVSQAALRAERIPRHISQLQGVL